MHSPSHPQSHNTYKDKAVIQCLRAMWLLARKLYSCSMPCLIFDERVQTNRLVSYNTYSSSRLAWVEATALVSPNGHTRNGATNFSASPSKRYSRCLCCADNDQTQWKRDRVTGAFISWVTDTSQGAVWHSQCENNESKNGALKEENKLGEPASNHNNLSLS